MARVARKKKRELNLDTRPDTVDFRDLMYIPTLVEVPMQIHLEEFQARNVPILDQGQEGACTGFGLATVAHYLLRTRKEGADDTDVSPRMIYEMAKRYDEYPGVAYSGSSARGAIKGWFNHGICSLTLWPYVAGQDEARPMTPDMTSDAQTRPLGAYFRVNHKDLVAMHSAIAEVGTLYATARVHEGWREPGTKGIIKQSDQMIGGHAFAIVAFDAEGFWIQNSWGTGWGLDGFGRVSYDDWLTNGSDVWVARLGAPIHVHAAGLAVTKSGVSGSTESVGIADLRPHIVSLGNDGRLRPGGAYGTNEADVAAVFDHFKERSKAWTKKRLLLYAHGGLVPEASAIQRLADYRKTLLDQEVYPISFIWHSDFMSTLVDILQDVLNRRAPEGFIDRAKDFMLDRLDDLLEPVARAIGGKAEWDQMKQNAIGATTLDETDDQGKRTRGGAWIALEHIANLMQSDPTVEVHVVGHSAGAIFQGPVVKLLTSKGEISGGILDGETGYGLKVETVTMWAPACTIDLFKGCYLPAIKSRAIGKFALFDLSDPTEQDDDCKGIYHKSLLYLVSNAFEATQRVPWSGQPGTPLLGMEKFVRSNPEVAAVFIDKGHRADLVLSPNRNDPEKGNGSTSQHHGGFDSDSATVRSTFKRVVGEFDASRRMRLAPLGSELRDRRRTVAAVRRY